jgi:hypothetical protein
MPLFGLKSGICYYAIRVHTNALSNAMVDAEENSVNQNYKGTKEREERP